MDEMKTDPMYWIMPVGLGLGVLVVLGFETITEGCRDRKSFFKALTKKSDKTKLDPSVEKQLNLWVDGVYNVAEFWSGGAVLSNLNKQGGKKNLQKVYEMLALLCALLFTVGVTFYTSNQSGDHTYGLVCCVANCALWMATLSSTFFAVVIDSIETDEQLGLLVKLCGSVLLRVPMMLFVWGTSGLFILFVLYFKLNVDPGYNCSMCLGACFIIAPLFFHCLHKMGWAAAVVHSQASVERKKAKVLNVNDLQVSLGQYLALKGGNCLALDRDEFLSALSKASGRALTSTQRTLALRMFEAHVEVELSKLGTPLPKAAEATRAEIRAVEPPLAQPSSSTAFMHSRVVPVHRS